MALMAQIFLASACSLVLLPTIFGSIEKMAQMKLIQSAVNEKVGHLVTRSLSHEISIKNKEFASNISKSQQYHELSSIDSNLLKKTNKFIIHNDWNGNTEVFLKTHSDDVYAFGSNIEGRLGFGDYGEVKEPKIIPELSGKSIKDIKCGDYFCVALTQHGQIYTFGNMYRGRTGNGHEDSIHKPIEISVDNQTITAIDCTRSSTFVLTQSGQLYWFGWLYFYGTNALTPTKVVLPSEVKIKRTSCGFDHVLALTEDGKVFSWGKNYYGQLGLGHYIDEDSPQMIELKENIKQISSGWYYSLLLTTNGKIYSMGDNDHGQLGLGNKEKQNIPQLVLLEQKEICCYGYISMSLDLNKKLLIWGEINEEVVVSPVLSEFNSFQEVVNKYAKYYSTLKPIELFNDEKHEEKR